MASGHEELKELERSPDGRYIRFDFKLGDGAYKAVWLGYDTEMGIDVAWNLVDLRRIPAKERDRIRGETELLKHLNHQHIINFYSVWENQELDQVVFITERVTSGSLKQYINRVKPLKLKVIKRWCRQILRGLIYLHSQTPPIIHRDIKCDNIFIHGSTGELRIGDLGLSTIRSQTHVESVLGTPEFMAPELYDEYYNEKVDIYAFGMCVLEMVTNEYPYQECSNAAQIYKKVSQGVSPESLQKIKHIQTRRFIELCLSKVDVRPYATDLFEHPYLAPHCSDYRDSYHAGFPFAEVLPSSVSAPSKQPSTFISDSLSSNQPLAHASIQSTQPSASQTPQISSQPANPGATNDVTTQEIILESVKDNIARIVLRIHLRNKRQEIKFPFDLTNDSPEAVAAEMVKELGLADSARVKLADGIFISIRNHCESWKSFVKSKRDMPRLEKPIPENRDLSLLSVESGEGETLEITAPAVFDSVEAPSPSSVVFMSEAEQLNNAELLRRIDELSHHTTKTADIEKKELVQLYVDLKIKQNQSERISLLEKETPAGNVSLLPQESSQASVINTPKETLDSSYPRNRHQRKGSLDLFADVDSDTMSLGESKNQAAELELIRLILEKKSPLSSQLTPDQAEELAEADRKRTYELRLHKKAYLKAKFLTNRKFNLDSMELLKKWGFDINALVQSESSSRIASSKADSNVEVGLNSGASVSENLLLTDQFPTASFASLDSQLGTAPPGSLKKTGAPKFSSRTQRALNEVDDKAKFRSHKASASNQAAVGTTTRQKARNRSDVVGGTTGIQEIDVDDIEQKLTQPFFQTRGLVASKAPTPSSNKPQNSQSQPSNSSMFSMNPQ